jgi:hypothetical protein
MNMKNKSSAILSLIICILSSLALIGLIVTMPSFFPWFYGKLNVASDSAERIIRTVIITFYCCAPFAAAALTMMIIILMNIIKEKVFIPQNVLCFRLISWCCYAVFIITAVACAKYFPLVIVAFAMAVIGTLLRVIKNILQSAVELREENDLTI